MAANERVSSLVIKARDEYSRALANLEKRQGSLAAAQKRASDISAAKKALQEHRDAYLDLERQLKNTSAVLTELHAKKQRNTEDFSNYSLAAVNLAARLKALRNDTASYQAALDRVKAQHQSGFKAFSQRIEATRRQEEAAKAATAAEQKLAEMTARRQAVESQRAVRQAGNASAYTTWSQGVDQSAATRAAEIQARQTAVLEQRQARLNGTMQSGFATWSKAIDREQRLAAVRERLANQTKSGFAQWSRYVDAVDRVRTTEEKAASIAARKAAIQDRLNYSVRSGFAAWSKAVRGVDGYSNAINRNVTQLKLLETQARRTQGAIGPLQAEIDSIASPLRPKPSAPSGSDGTGQNGAKGNAQDVEIWGLRPWQLTNLGYQINDVVSGLAMGQAPVQILAQQAGQFVQIWPQVMVALARSIPIIAGVTAALTPFFVALSRARKEAETLKVMEENLALLADGANYSADALAQAARGFERLGVPIADARKAIVELTKLGVDQSDIFPIGQMADRLSEITGEDFADEVTRIAEAFKGGAESVRELDRDLKFLTAEQLRNIYALDRAGDRTQALALAQDALKTRLDASRRSMTPWQSAVKEMSSSWNDFITAIQKSGIVELAAKGVDVLALSVKGAAAVLEGAVAVITPPDLAQQYGKLNKERQGILDAIKEAENEGGLFNDLGFSDGNSAYMQGLLEDLQDVEARIDEIGAAIQSNAKKQSSANAESAAAVKLAEEELKQREDALRAVESYLKDVEKEGRQGSMSDREIFVDNALIEAQREINKGKKDEVALESSLVDLIKQRANAAYDFIEQGKRDEAAKELTKDFNAQVEALRVQADLVMKSKREQFILSEIEKAKAEWKEKDLLLDKKKLAVLREQAGITFDAENSKEVTDQFKAQIKALRAQAALVTKSKREQFILVEVERLKTSLAERGLATDRKKLQLLREQAGRTFDAQVSTDLNRDFDAQIDALRLQAILVTETKREQFILAELEKTKTAWAEQGLEIDKEKLRILREQAGNTFDTQASAELTKAFDDQVKALQLQASLVTETKREQFILAEIEKTKANWAEKGLEIDKEKLKILREQAGITFDAQTSAFTTGSYGSVVDRIVGVESAGKADAKNPDSSATGLGQFIKSTWLDMFRKYFPDRAASMTEEAILALRLNASESRRMVELYARENAAVLQQAGIAVSDAAIYLAHFLGPGGAQAVLQAAPDTPVSELLGADQIASNRSILEGKTAGQVTGWAENKMGVSDGEVALNVQLAEIEADRLKTQRDYLVEYQKRIADQQFELDLMREGAREAAIAEALRAEELAAKEAGLTLTEAQVAEIKKLTGATFDRQNAELRVNQLLEEQAELAKALETAQHDGDLTMVDILREDISLLEEELQKAIDAAIAFYEAMGGEGADIAIMKLQNMRDEVGRASSDLKTKFLPSAEDLNETIAETGANAFDDWAQGIAEGQGVFESFVNAVKKGLGEILVELGKAIIKQAIFNALTGGKGGTAGGLGGMISGAIGGLFKTAHTGGTVGSLSSSKMVNPAVFAGAARYHGGGIVGERLKPNEEPIIALKGEEVLTEDDPNHSKNRGGRPKIDLSVNNFFDPADMMEKGLSTAQGQQAFMNFVNENPRKIKTALGV